MQNKPKSFVEIMKRKTDREIHTVSALLGAILFLCFTPMSMYFVVWLGVSIIFSFLLMKKLKQIRDEP